MRTSLRHRTQAIDHALAAKAVWQNMWVYIVVSEAPPVGPSPFSGSNRFHRIVRWISSVSRSFSQSVLRIRCFPYNRTREQMTFAIFAKLCREILPPYDPLPSLRVVPLLPPRWSSRKQSACAFWASPWSISSWWRRARCLRPCVSRHTAFASARCKWLTIMRRWAFGAGKSVM